MVPGRAEVHQLATEILGFERELGARKHRTLQLGRQVTGRRY